MKKFKFILRSSGLMVVAAVLLAVSISPSASAVEWPTQPSDMTGNRFRTGSICVTSSLRSDLYPVGAIAQQWNIVSAPDLALSFKSSCGVAHSIVVGVFNNPSLATCLYFTGTNSAFPYGDGSLMKAWQTDIGVYINAGIPGCVSTAQRRSHQVAAGIGHALGLQRLSSSGWSQRVMCTCSLDTLRAPSYAEGNRVSEIYSNKYGGGGL